MLESLQTTDFLVPANFLVLTAVLFVIVFLRYLLISSAFHYFIHVLFRTQLDQRILNHHRFSRSQMKSEILWSTVTSLIFAFSGVLMVVSWQKGWTQLYTSWDEYTWVWIPISFLIGLLLHDTYYYWLHRWMHQSRSIYLLVHKVHHDSIITNAMTSFSFHPIESIFQAIIIPLIVFVIPMHWSVLLLLLVLMTVSGTVNHAGAEVYTVKWKTHPLWKWVIGASHHDLHHKKFNHNYGLYFTFWDRWMGTEYDEPGHKS